MKTTGEASAAPAREVLLDVENLHVTFGRGRKAFEAVKGVNFQIYKGETFGLVGESGSGKTTIGRTIIRIYPASQGQITFQGERISGRISRALDKQVIRNIQMIFQDPMASLNERAKVSDIVKEGLNNIQKGLSKQEVDDRVSKALLDVGLLPEFASRFPHEFSGGQRQRIGIARALIMEPSFIIADEPISALDVSVRAQVLNLLSELQKQRGLTYMFIAHDLSVTRFISDRIAVIEHGKIVELAPTEMLFSHPLHPYTRSLLSAIPVPNPDVERQKKLLVYDSKMHNYTQNPPTWTENAPEHFVVANEAELETYRTSLQKLS
ncbi:MAG: ATP-binding cassette domain-containing protein [Lachnospiraceae bacterium]|nr:ATP-binding cassette domain-containing protein [Lachnospiraceae bacterium]